MKSSILVIPLIIVIVILIGYIIREGRPTFRQQFGQKIANIIMAREAFGGQEAFGVSPGTLTQLAANHVPTVNDIPMLRQWVADRKQGIYQMTESDLVGKAPMEYSILGSRIGAFA